MDKFSIYRDQRIVTPGTSDTLFMGSNARRRMLIVSCPVPTAFPSTADNTLTGAVSTATTGIKSTYTVPAGVQAVLDSATMLETTGVGVVAALQIVRAAVTLGLASFTTSGTFTGQIPLQAGDVIQFNVTTAVAASVCDFTINVARNNAVSRVSLSFKGAAVLDEGLNLYAGGPAILLLPEDVGQGLVEEIRCIGSVAGLTIGVIELSYG